MAIFERPKNQKVIINTIMIMALMSISLLMVLLIWKTTQLSNVNSSVVSNVAIGPIRLIEIQKTPVATGGFQASIKFLPGVLIYFMIWAVVVILVSVYRLSEHRED